jgi:hypothetical protein
MDSWYYYQNPVLCRVSNGLPSGFFRIPFGFFHFNFRFAYKKFAVQF